MSLSRKKKNIRKKTKKINLFSIGGSDDISNALENSIDIIVNFKNNIYIKLISHVLGKESLNYIEFIKIISSNLSHIMSIMSIMKEIKKIDENSVLIFINKLKNRDEKYKTETESEWYKNKKKYLRINLAIILALITLYLPLNDKESINLITETQKNEMKQKLHIYEDNKKNIKKTEKNNNIINTKKSEIMAQFIDEIYKIIINNTNINNINMTLANSIIVKKQGQSNLLSLLESIQQYTQYKQNCIEQNEKICYNFIETKDSVDFILNFVYKIIMIFQTIKTDPQNLELLRKNYNVKDQKDLINKDKIKTIINSNPKSTIKAGSTLYNMLNTRNAVVNTSNTVVNTPYPEVNTTLSVVNTEVPEVNTTLSVVNTEVPEVPVNTEVPEVNTHLPVNTEENVNKKEETTVIGGKRNNKNTKSSKSKKSSKSSKSSKSKKSIKKNNKKYNIKI